MYNTVFWHRRIAIIVVPFGMLSRNLVATCWYSLDSALLDDLARIGGGQYSFIPDIGLVGTVPPRGSSGTKEDDWRTLSDE